MTDNEMRTAIAQACGLHPVKCPLIPNQHKTGHNGHWFTPEAADQMRRTYQTCAAPKVIPDYLNDLNAMHEAEKSLTGEQWSQYFEEVQQLARKAETISCWRNVSPSYLIDVFAVHATARQRAEAFLLVKGLWK